MSQIPHTTATLPMHFPGFAAQSLRQRHSSMYQHHTYYVDHNRMAVTDVFFQEHVSQSSWTMAAPQQYVFQQSNPYINGTNALPLPPRPNYYIPISGSQYYANGAGSMNAYNHMYSTRSASATSYNNLCAGDGIYIPQFIGRHPQGDYYINQPDKQSCDVAIQANLYDPIGKIIKQKYVTTSSQTDTSIGIDDTQHGLLRNSEVLLSPQHFQEITRISLYGSEIAEKLAIAHRSRPCFKKIDTLCARLKQDLLRPDGVLPNINSQGVAWAVKDFIFVFTRIINAWVILKGYVYNTPEGLNKIKDELPSGFMAAFDTWQCSTISLIDMIIKSFVNLDELLQKQKNLFARLDTNINISSTDSSSHNSTLGGSGANCMSKGFNPSGRSTPNNNGSNEHYMLKLSSADVSSADPHTSIPLSDDSSNSKTCLNYLYTMVKDSEKIQRIVAANGSYFKTGTYAPLKYNQKEQNNDTDTNHVQTDNDQQPTITNTANLEHKKVLGLSYSQSKKLGFEFTHTLSEFANLLMDLQHTECFFLKHFTRNYYPDLYFRFEHEFVDIRTIIMKCESGIYHHIYEAVHDLRHIVHFVRTYLKGCVNEELRTQIEFFENAVNIMLSKLPNLTNQYDHITGATGEKLFIYHT